MTLRYSDMNQHDALYKAARQYPGGLEALAQRMGISVNVLRNKLSPGIDSHYPSFEEVTEIIELLKGVNLKDALLPVHAMNWRLGLISLTIPCAQHLSDDDIARSVCTTMKEFGAVASSVSEVLADGNLARHHLDQFDKEFRDAFAALGQLHARIHERFDPENKGCQP